MHLICFTRFLKSFFLCFFLFLVIEFFGIWEIGFNDRDLVEILIYKFYIGKLNNEQNNKTEQYHTEPLKGFLSITTCPKIPDFGSWFQGPNILTLKNQNVFRTSGF